MTREEYSQAYSSSYKLTMRFLLSRGVPIETAEEAAQAAWAKGWEHREDLRNPERVASWVNAIAMNLFRNAFRRRKTLERRIEDRPELGKGPNWDPRVIDLRRRLKTCPRGDREVIEGHYLEGFTSEELGQKAGCSAVAVRVRLLRARRRIAASLEPERGEKAGSDSLTRRRVPRSHS
jgi:RNA polymerase sigma-70 factor (ECF subfamily)